MTDKQFEFLKEISIADMCNTISSRTASMEYDFKLAKKRIAELEAQIEKMKCSNKTSYIKGLRTMANAIKKHDREYGAWTDYVENTVNIVLDNLLKEIKEK